MTSRPEGHLTISVHALGGQGGGILADWVVAAAEANDCLAQATSVPGVAQRTGATVYYLEIFPEVLALRKGKPPVLALMPMPGDVDVVIASELMEAGRAIKRVLVTPDRTTLITSTHRIYAIAEKSAQGDGRADGESVLTAARARARRLHALDMEAAAEATGSAISAVMFGALAGADVLSFPREACEAAIRTSGVAVASNLAGFAAGWEAVARNADNREAVVGASPPRPASAWEERIRATLPPRAWDMACEGLNRVVDYQDLEYGRLYLERLEAVAAIDGGDGELTREVARRLAVWMSYEDSIRVAELKTRRSRFERVRSEVRAAPGQIVYVREYLHPRPEEARDLMPPGLARLFAENRLLANLLSRVLGRGRHVETNRLGGFLLLWSLARLRPLRRLSSRFVTEEARIRGWLADVSAAAAAHPGFALEVARCAELLKGYSDTFERSLRNFEAVVAEARRLTPNAEAAARLSVLRDAALADDTGGALASALASPGAERRTALVTPGESRFVLARRAAASAAPFASS